MEDKNILKIAKECLKNIKTNLVFATFVTKDIELGKKFAVLINGKIKTKAYYVSGVDGKPILMIDFSDSKKEKVISVLEKFIEEREKND